MSAHDMRKLVLVNQIQKRFVGSGVKITKIEDVPSKEPVDPKVGTEEPEESIIEILSEEEDCRSKSVVTTLQEGNNNNQSISEVEVLGEYQGGKATGGSEDQPVKTTTDGQWKIVKRSKRKVRLFIFQDEVNTTPEVLVIQSKDHTTIPSLLNGRRSLLVMHGVDYGLGEGEGVLVDTEEERRQIKLANNEKYAMDSFCVDNGFLSESEMMETPGAGCLKVKQKRRAGVAQARLKFDQPEEAEVLGCLWRLGIRGRANPKMKKWTALDLMKVPIPTTVNSIVPNDAPEDNPPPVPPPEKLIGDGSEFATKYAIKYTVKFLVSKRFAEVAPLEFGAMYSMVRQEAKDVVKEDRLMTEKYVHKYVNKFKLFKPSN